MLKKSFKVLLCIIVVSTLFTVHVFAATHKQYIYYNQQGSTSRWKFASSAGSKGFYASSSNESDNTLNIKFQWKKKGTNTIVTVFNYNLDKGKSHSLYKTCSDGDYRVILNPKGACAHRCVATVNMQY